MNTHFHRLLLGAAVAGLLAGAAAAQTTSDDPARLPAQKATAQEPPASPAAQPTDKIKDQSKDKMKDQSTDKMKDQPADKAKDQGGTQGGATDQAKQKDKAAAAKSSKPAKQASRARDQRVAAAADPDEKAFRQALRECAKQQDQGQRDNCLDSAIEQFQRG